jgi:hypothetical protein
MPGMRRGAPSPPLPRRKSSKTPAAKKGGSPGPARKLTAVESAPKMTPAEKAVHAATTRWRDPRQRKKAAAATRARMIAVWALAKAGAKALEKRKKAA